MLIEFAIENFKSFKDRTYFSMEATADRKLPENVIEVRNEKDKEIKLLKTSMIYGANASGKTNFIDAMDLFKQLVMHSHTYINVMPYIPFIFDESCSKKPTTMEIKFLKEGILYEYTFSYNSSKILSESLIYFPNRRKAIVFERKEQNFKFVRDKKWQSMNAKGVKETALYLTVSAQFNYEISKNVVEWILNNFLIFIGGNENFLIGTLLDRMEKDQLLKKRALKAFRIADLGIVDMKNKNQQANTAKTIETQISFPVASIIFHDIWVKHSLEGSAESQKTAELPLAYESTGTIKFMSIVGPIITVLSNGGTIIIDEMDVNFHSELVKWIINLFHDPKENLKGAQLIFNTHNVELLNLDLIRRDQIWFMGKDWNNGSSSLHSLAEYSERNDRDIRKAYLSGRYGARPFISPDRLIE